MPQTRQTIFCASAAPICDAKQYRHHKDFAVPQVGRAAAARLS